MRGRIRTVVLKSQPADVPETETKQHVSPSQTHDTRRSKTAVPVPSTFGMGESRLEIHGCYTSKGVKS